MPRRKYLRDLSRKDTKSREQNILSPLVRDGYKAGICRDVSTVVTESGGEIKTIPLLTLKIVHFIGVKAFCVILFSRLFGGTNNFNYICSLIKHYD